ncbi:hypothetical protein AGMMS50233_00710 [Endomicrobiia bacterium]|nr:hypothetical protein AGMMS50233_00710 [Endomicrobiia bacterium]
MDTRFHEYDKQKNVALSAVVIPAKAGIHLTFNMDTRFHEYDKQKNVALSTVVIMMAIFKRSA